MASRRSLERKHGPKAAPELDLKPVMNLMVCLIPMLLYSAQFIKFAAINITKASSGTGSPSEQNPDEEKKPPLKLRIKITSEGFKVEGALILDEEKVNASPGDDGSGSFQPVELYDIPVNVDLSKEAVDLIRNEYKSRGQQTPTDVEEMIRKVYSYDYVQLNSKIDLIKQAVQNGGGGNAFDKHDQIIIASEGDVPFELLVQTMDSVRCKFNKEKKGFMACQPKPEDGIGKEDPNTLYYDVVLDAALLE